MKKTRKLLCFVLSLLMVLCLFPVTVQAAQPPSGSHWAIDVNGQLTIGTSIGMYDWCNASSSYHPEYRTLVKSVVILDDGVTDANDVVGIDDNAFYGCLNLKSVTIPTTVKGIGNGAFFGCTSLTRVDIPDSVTDIGNSAFQFCSNLSSVMFSGTTPPSTVGATVFDTTTLAGIIVPVGSVDSYKTALAGYESLIKPISVAITKNKATTYYPTLTTALAAAENGDTVTLIHDITESAIYTIPADTTLTIDGKGHKVTAVDDDESYALNVYGDGTLWLKDIILQGGTADKISCGLMVGDGSSAPSVNVYSSGTVNVIGGRGDNLSLGVGSTGTGSLSVTTASGSSDVAHASNAGAANYGSGTINVGTATASGSGDVTNYGVLNYGTGTINVNKAEANGDSDSDSCGAYNMSSGIINVTDADGTRYGVRNHASGTVNATDATGGECGAWNDNTGTVNVGTATATELGKGGPLPGVHNIGTGTINTGTSVAAFTLQKGSDTTCVLGSITVASTGTTNIGTLPIVCKNGVYSDKWYTDSAKTTLFSGTTVTGAATLYSYFYTLDTGGSGGHGGGGGGSSADTSQEPETTFSGNTSVTTLTTEATVDGNGRATASISQVQMSDAVDQAVEEAKKQGDDTITVVKIKVEASKSSKSSETSISKSAITVVADNEVDALIISTPISSLNFDKKAIKSIKTGAVGDIQITALKVDAASLSGEAKAAVGDRPVYDFSVSSGGKTISQFGGNVTVSVPYTLAEEENPNAIVIYYINAEGKLEIVGNCYYDSASRIVTFTTDHFSTYAVGYNKVNFSDVAANSWYGDAVSFVAARDITTGTGNGNYSPDAKLTRGQFLVMVMRAYGIETDSASSDNFSDAGNTYYTGYLAVAKSLGITDGIGNNMFAPGKEITRQEMFTLLYNTLDSIGELPAGTTGKALTSYNDVDKIASWATDAMTLFVGSGTISGSGDQLNPSGTTNRAEMAQVLYNLLSK